MKLGDLSITYVELLANAVRGLGHDPEPLLEHFRIQAETLASPDTRISIPRFMRLGYQAMTETQAPWLGLEMGRVGQPSHLGVAGLLALTAPTLKDACQAVTHYELLSSYNSRGASSFSIQGNKAYLRFYSINPYNDFNMFVVDSVLAGWHKLLIDITGQGKLVSAIDIEFPAPSYADKYSEYFSCPVRFNAEHNQLVINCEALPTAVIQNCASVHEGLKRIADKELEQVRFGVSVRESVARTIGPMLNGATPELDAVARKLNMASWTLRRRLQAEDVTFQQVLNETRQSLAESYVRETSLTLGEIAYVLGFGSAAAFQRAFKRWTGEAPGRFRENYRDLIQNQSLKNSR